MISALLIAVKEYGTKAITGSSHNARVLRYFKDIGHAWVQDDETAWCAAFMNWCLLHAGIVGTKKLNARSFLMWGESVTKPELGDVVVLWRITPQSPYGHVGFFVGQSATHVYLLGGNQSNEVNITPFPKSQVLGYRRFVEKK